jgi:hypothetical protein
MYIDISNQIENDLDSIMKEYILKLSIFYEKDIDVDMHKLLDMTKEINTYLAECVEKSMKTRR